MDKKRLSIIIRSLIIFFSIIGIVLCHHGLISFSYFTILSNIYLDIMVFIFLIKDIITLKKDKFKLPKIAYISRFYSVIAIFLTFFVFMFILAPVYSKGFIGAYTMDNYGSIFVHLLAPVLAIIDFLFFDNEEVIEYKYSFFSTIPPLCYVVFVVIAGQLGLRWGSMYAPYNFLNYMSPIGWFGFDLSLMSDEYFGIGTAYMIVILLIIFILIGRLLLFISNKIYKRDI